MTAKKKSLKKKETAGEIALKLQSKNDKINPIDLQREFHKGKTSSDSHEEQIKQAIERGKKEFKNDFFIIQLLKKERILQNIVRVYTFPRKSCPTPDYDQSVYRYLRKEDIVEFIWCIPDKQACNLLILNKDIITPEQHWLLSFVEEFNSGKLLLLAKKFNNEIN